MKNDEEILLDIFTYIFSKKTISFQYEITGNIYFYLYLFKIFSTADMNEKYFFYRG